MFPKPHEVKGKYVVHSPSRDPEKEGRRIARGLLRTWVFFLVMATAAAYDVWGGGDGNDYMLYVIAAVLSLVPLSVTIF